MFGFYLDSTRAPRRRRVPFDAAALRAELSFARSSRTVAGIILRSWVRDSTLRPPASAAVATVSMIVAATLVVAGCPNSNQPPQLGAGVASVTLERVADGLTAPVALADPDDGSGRLLVADQIGQVRVIEAGGGLRDAPVVDLSTNMVTVDPDFDERGLLGLAAHPDFAVNRRVFVAYNAPAVNAGTNSRLRLSEIALSDDFGADLASEVVILEIDKPQGNHNGGCVVFGGDGFLYLSVGDGGNGHDVGEGHTPEIGNAQDKSKLLGKLLRIDVDSESPYSVPPDNPFIQDAQARPEIWAYGLRNAWRFSFYDSGRVILGDVGQGRYEEVSVAAAGDNLGWNRREGAHCFDSANPSVEPASCADTGPDGATLVDPVFDYPHAGGGIRGNSITGGYVYRGNLVSGLRGLYIFGDWSRSFVAGDAVLLLARPADEGRWPVTELGIAGSSNGRLNRFLLAFGQDAAGEVYLLTSGSVGPSGTTGAVDRIVAGE